MPELNTKVFAGLLSSTTATMTAGAGATTLYTVPTGKTLRITAVVIRDTSASLASGTSYSITNFRAAFSLTGMTTANTTYRVIHATDNTDFTETAAGVAITLTVGTGSAAAATAVIDLYGYLT